MDKKGHKELLIIMPAYNEEKNIGKVLEQLERAGVCEYADVLVMNDASSDATNWLVKARGYTLVTHVFNLGYGSALQLGYKYAIRRKWMQMGSMMFAIFRCCIKNLRNRMQMEDVRILCWGHAFWKKVKLIRLLIKRRLLIVCSGG